MFIKGDYASCLTQSSQDLLIDSTKNPQPFLHTPLLHTQSHRIPRDPATFYVILLGQWPPCFQSESNWVPTIGSRENPHSSTNNQRPKHAKTAFSTRSVGCVSKQIIHWWHARKKSSLASGSVPSICMPIVKREKQACLEMLAYCQRTRWQRYIKKMIFGYLFSTDIHISEKSSTYITVELFKYWNELLGIKSV